MMILCWTGSLVVLLSIVIVLPSIVIVRIVRNASAPATCWNFLKVTKLGNGTDESRTLCYSDGLVWFAYPDREYVEARDIEVYARPS